MNKYGHNKEPDANQLGEICAVVLASHEFNNISCSIFKL